MLFQKEEVRLSTYGKHRWNAMLAPYDGLLVLALSQ